jgi:pectin methylesterase-like acyl-CoA thioesterase
MRKLAWEFGKQLRPDYGQFEDLHLALGLNAECEETLHVLSSPLIFTAADRTPAPKTFPPTHTRPVVDTDAAGADARAADAADSADHDAAASTTSVAYFVDYSTGTDTNTGTLTSPFKTIQAAVNAATNKPNPTVNLRAGTHYLSSTVQVSAANSGLTIQNYNGERVHCSVCFGFHQMFSDRHCWCCNGTTRITPLSSSSQMFSDRHCYWIAHLVVGVESA